MILDEDTGWSDYCQFLESCDNKVFVKAPVSCRGKDVWFCQIETEEDMRKLFERRLQSFILEEQVLQFEELYSFSSSSVNTLRIITLAEKW